MNDRSDIIANNGTAVTSDVHSALTRGRWAEIAVAVRRSGVHRFSTWVESFLYAGLSALLLLIANLFPGHWYLSLVAMTPFLYRVSQADGEEGARLGFLMGLSYLTVSSLTAPSTAGWCLPLITGTVLFTLCGWSMGCARTAFGFRPSVVAVLWAAFEFGYHQVGHSAGLLGQPALGAPYMQGLAALFGFVVVSVIIVVINSLLVLAFRAVAELLLSSRKIRTGRINLGWFIPARTIKYGDVFLFPESRGPPIILFL